MPVIRDNAEERLCAQLQLLAGTPMPWQMAVLHGRQLPHPVQRALRHDLTRVSLLTLSQQHGIAVYYLTGGDIAFLYESEETQAWERMCQLFHVLFPDINPNDIDCRPHFTMYTLARQFHSALHWVQESNSTPQEDGFELVDMDEAAWNHALFRQALAQRRSRVLKLACVIEDNRAQRQLAQSILRTEYDVICAADGQEGLQLYNAQAPDIVFLDIHLPLMDGISVLTHIRRHDEASRIVMFSQQSNPSVLKGAMQQGALGFVSKPFTADALIKYARKALAE